MRSVLTRSPLLSGTSVGATTWHLTRRARNSRTTWLRGLRLAPETLVTLEARRLNVLAEQCFGEGASVTRETRIPRHEHCLGHKSAGAGVLLATRNCVDSCVEDYTMATNLSIDPKLIEDALKVSGERTKRAAVTRALEEFIARRRQKRMLELFGKLEWDRTYDYKAERSRE